MVSASHSVPDLNALTADLVGRARELVPLLRQRAAAAERQGRVHGETYQALRDADLFRAYVPRAYGGYELPPQSFWRIAAEIARGCPSTSWVYSVLTCHTFVFALYPKRAQDEIFGADANVGICGVLPDRSVARSEGGGFMVSNSTWPFGSGCHHAQWMMLGVRIEGYAPGYDKAFCMVPAQDIEIQDDWDVAGLKATGSNSLRLKTDELFVPTHRVLKAETALAHKYGDSRARLYRAPMGPVLALTLGLGTTVGAATAALEYFEDLAMHRSDRPLVYTDDVRKVDLPATRRIIAEATAKLEVARLLGDRACELAYGAAADSTRVLGNEARARIRLYGVHAMHQCREIVTALYLESGGSALHASNLMQRLHRDVHAMTMHEAFHLGTIQDTYGRVRLNQPTTHWLL